MTTTLIIFFLYAFAGHVYAVLKTPTVKNKFIVWRFYINCALWLPLILTNCALYLLDKLNNTTQ